MQAEVVLKLCKRVLMVTHRLVDLDVPRSFVAFDIAEQLVEAWPCGQSLFSWDLLHLLQTRSAVVLPYGQYIIKNVA